MNPITVCIVEDNEDFRDWLVSEVSDTGQVTCIGKYARAEEALQEIPRLEPDIVLMDLHLKDSRLDGIGCMLHLKLLLPSIKFMVISSLADEGKIFEALRVGAGSYIQKGEIPGKILDLILEFHAGGSPMSLGISRRVVKSFQQNAGDLSLIKELSDREVEVLNQLGKGLLDKEIADRLSISPRTVGKHLNNIYDKLQVNNRTEAIRKYICFQRPNP